MFFSFHQTPTPPLPRRVRAAMDFMEFCKSITEPCCGEPQPPRRQLTAKEKAAYDAAVETIRAYVVGELELADEPARATEEAPE